MDDPFKEAASIIEDLGLSKVFIGQLYKEDDWSFVVKGHALMESAISYMLSRHLKNESLEKPFGEIEMNDRINFLSALDLLSGEERRMLRRFSKLRNDIVHVAKNTGFKFSNHFSTSENKKNFLESFTYHLSDPVKWGNETLDRNTFALKYPRETIFFAIFQILNMVYLEKRNFQINELAKVMALAKNEPD